MAHTAMAPRGSAMGKRRKASNAHTAERLHARGHLSTCAYPGQSESIKAQRVDRAMHASALWRTCGSGGHAEAAACRKSCKLLRSEARARCQDGTTMASTAPSSKQRAVA